VYKTLFQHHYTPSGRSPVCLRQREYAWEGVPYLPNGALGIRDTRQPRLAST